MMSLVRPAGKNLNSPRRMLFLRPGAVTPGLISRPPMPLHHVSRSYLENGHYKRFSSFHAGKVIQSQETVAT